MPADRVDVLFLIDASASMKPCFDKLIQYVNDFVRPLNQAHFESVRLGILAYKSSFQDGKVCHQHTVLGGSDAQFMRDLYAGNSVVPLMEEDTPFFTHDVEKFRSCLRSIVPSGDENSLLALDTAADFPFEPAATTRRVIVWFTDEKIEDGITRDKPNAKANDICKKIHKRKITLYAFAPHSSLLEMPIGRTPKAIIENVPEAINQESQSGTWDSLDFQALMESMGKSISESTLQQSRDEFVPATYGQNNEAVWDECWAGNTVDTSGWIEVPVGGFAATTALKSFKVSLYWRTPIDLDLHAFIQFRDGDTGEVYFAKKDIRGVWLDRDAGVGGTFDFDGYNEEVMTVEETAMPNIEKVLFATKIFNAGGCFADYKGEVHVMPLHRDGTSHDKFNCKMESTERKDWCVIAMLDNTDPERPVIHNLNRVCAQQPDLRDF